VIFDGTFKKFSTEKYSYIRSFNFFHMALGKNLSEYLHKNGYRTRIWTLDTPEETPQIKLDGIITDRPDLF
jgi:glycerophosphoryl diester phosphodiesterase